MGVALTWDVRGASYTPTAEPLSLHFWVNMDPDDNDGPDRVIQAHRGISYRWSDLPVEESTVRRSAAFCFGKGLLISRLDREQYDNLTRDGQEQYVLLPGRTRNGRVSKENERAASRSSREPWLSSTGKSDHISQMPRMRWIHPNVTVIVIECPCLPGNV